MPFLLFSAAYITENNWELSVLTRVSNTSSSTNKMPSIESRIASLAQDIDTLSKDVAQDEPSRKSLLGAIQGAMAKVESPVETIWRIIMSVW